MLNDHLTNEQLQAALEAVVHSRNLILQQLDNANAEIVLLKAKIEDLELTKE